jgi:hypothetical protein
MSTLPVRFTSHSSAPARGSGVVRLRHDPGVDVADVCGSSWWGIIHGVAQSIHDHGCANCGKHAISLMRYAHDLVNVSLDKPTFAPEATAEWEPHAKQLAAQLGAVHQAQPKRRAPRCRFNVDTFDTAPKAVSRFMRDLGTAQRRGDADGFVHELNALCSTTQPRLPGMGRMDARRSKPAPEVVPGVVHRPAQGAGRPQVRLLQSCPELDFKASIDDRMKGAECRALDAFARGKYWMGGYHAANWVNLNKTLPGLGRTKVRRTPFKSIVEAARDEGYGKGAEPRLDPNDFGDPQLQLLQEDDAVKISGKCSGTECSLTATTGGKTLTKQPKIRVPVTAVTHEGVRRAVKDARAQLKEALAGQEAAAVETPRAGIGRADRPPAPDDAAAHTRIVRSADDVPVEVWETWAQLDGTRIEMEIEAVPLEQVVASNDPETFGVNPEYPGWLQPRDRARAANVVQVRTMAGALDPARLLDDYHTLEGGAPVVYFDYRQGKGKSRWYVVSGNGRAMAVALAFKEHPAAYHRYYAAMVERGWADPKYTQPVMLVRILNPQLDEKQIREIAELGNVAKATATSSVEQAAIDTAVMSGEFIGRLSPLDDESATIAGTVKAAKNRAWVTEFLGKVPATQLAELVGPDGALNTTGVERAVMALTMWTFGVEDDGRRLAEFAFESLEGDAKNVMQGTMRAVPRLASMRAQLQGYVADAGPETMSDALAMQDAYDLTPTIARSILRYIKIKADNQRVADALAQGSFDDPISPLEASIIRMFESNKRSARAIGDYFNAYASRVQAEPNPNQATMLEASEVSENAGLELIRRLLSEPAPSIQGGMLELSKRLTAKARRRLPRSSFACPDERAYPIYDAGHVRAAIGRYQQADTLSCPGGEKRICRAAKKFKIHAEVCAI